MLPVIALVGRPNVGKSTLLYGPLKMGFYEELPYDN